MALCLSMPAVSHWRTCRNAESITLKCCVTPCAQLCVCVRTPVDECWLVGQASVGPEIEGCMSPPLVAHSSKGDLASYLLDADDVGRTDVFFASDFAFLQMAYVTLR